MHPTSITTRSTIRLVIELLRTRRRRPLAASLRLVLAVLLVLALPPAGGAEDSEWRIGQNPAGEGLVLPWGLWVAGDLTLGVEALRDEPATGEIDDVSLLLRYEPIPRLALFGEVRFEDLVEVIEGEGVTTDHAQVAIERLYAETLLTPSLTLRLGKVFTPFGLWNVIRRTPLTWTVDAPAVTEGVFPTRTTGLSLLYQRTWHGWSFDATTYGPAQDALTFQHSGDGDGDENQKGWLVGTRLAAGRAVGATFGSVGLNAAGFRGREQPAWRTATGLDLEVSTWGHQVTSELTFRIPASGGWTVYGLYLQDAIPLEPLTPLARDLYAVVRFEQFRPHRGHAAVGGLVGLFWRPLPILILRADYLWVSRTLPNLEPGFHASVSLLF